MTCSLNSPLSEDTLSAVIDGLVDDETSAHLAQCPGCRARLEAARAVEHSLHTRLYRFDCPSSQELADYHLGFVAATDPIRDRLADILEIDPTGISEGDSFTDDLEADSLALIELVEALEEELGERSVGFRIDDEDLEDLKTVRDAVDYVVARV